MRITEPVEAELPDRCICGASFDWHRWRSPANGRDEGIWHTLHGPYDDPRSVALLLTDTDITHGDLDEWLAELHGEAGRVEEAQERTRHFLEAMGIDGEDSPQHRASPVVDR